MVRFITLVGAAALLAQSAFGATVPVRRTNHESNVSENNYNQQYNQYQQQQSNQYEQPQRNQHEQQQNNQYEQPQRNQYEQPQYNNNYQQQQQQQHETTIVRSHETSTAVRHESSVMAHETTTSAMAHETTVRQLEQSSVMAHETSTAEYVMPTHGSGSSQWGNNYNDCVSQCMAQFGTPPSRMTMEVPQPSATEGATGAIHTVMVAPEGAGLRYVPFAVNASVGDTIRYVWTTPKNHTATLSSALAICNKSGIAEQRNFVSGVRNAESGPQTFDVVLQTAEPQFFYCSVGQHCSSGMFGLINPATASASGASTASTVGQMMSEMMQNNPSMEAAYQYLVQNMTDGRAASQWGLTMSLEGIPESSYPDVAANVLFTQASFAANPGMMESNGAQTPDNSPIAIPADFNVLLTNIALTAPTSTSVSGEAAATSTSRPAASATGSLVPVNAADNAALSGKQGAGLWIAAVAGVAGWLLI